MSGHGVEGPTGPRGVSPARIRTVMRLYESRFQIVHVPIAGAGYCVRDNNRWQRRWGQGYTTPHLPHSSYYDTREEAVALAKWLAERATGYPVNLMLCEGVEP